MMQVIHKKYRSIAKCALQQAIAYRFSYFTGIMTNFLFVIFLFFLWKAIFADNSEIVGFTWEHMKAYILITFIANSNLFSEYRVARKILDGSVAMDLLKPINFQKVNLAETTGSAAFEMTINAVVITIVLVLTVGIMYPTEILTWILFAFSLINALMIKFSIIYIAGLFSFWTFSIVGVFWTRMALINLFSGALIPLAFFPDWLHSLSLYLPFQGIVNTPTAIYLGHMQGMEAAQMVALQFFWIFVLWNSGRLIYYYALRKVTIHGG
jgi:ABC-2 type transport system permease protein